VGVTDREESSAPPAGGRSATPGDETSTEGAPPPPLMLVMDASGSMNTTGPDGRTLLDSAKQALHDLVSALPDDQQVGLRVYGHRVPNTDQENGCQDTELIHPVSPLDRPALTEAIDGYQAVGFTPIGLSLQEAANDLPPEGPRTVVLVSDGEDTCAPPDPCEVASQLRIGGVELVINTVGFAISGNGQAREQLECIAEAGGGEFKEAENAAELAEALQESTRDPREAVLAGDELAGAPLPRDAQTGQVGTGYVDTVLGAEDNYYRFEISPGGTLRGEAVFSMAGTVPDGCEYVVAAARLTDAAEQDYFTTQIPTTVSVHPGEAATLHTNEVQVDANEVWLNLTTTDYSSTEACVDVEIEVELRLTVL
jgi:Ca-activated chloride channel family protein